MKERWYQLEAKQAYFDSLKTLNNNPLLVLPTGTGKSIIIANIIKDTLKKYPFVRVMMLTHVGELVKQNARKLQGALLQEVGIYSAGLGSLDTDNNVIFGTVQSVYSALKRDLNTFGVRHLIIIDECHLLSSNDNSMYRQVLSKFKELNHKLRVVGLTATPYRLRGGHLLEQDNPIFNSVAYDLSHSFNRLIEEGFLSDLVTLKPKTFFDMQDVSVERGDYKTSEVNEMFTTNLIKDACDFACDVANTQKRKHWLVFVSSIEVANELSQYLNDVGIPCASIHSKNNAKDNQEALELFRQGDLKALVNVDQLTTGFDVPFIDMLVVLRPTISASLHVQMLGRGTRPAVGKQNCLVLDFVGNIERLGAINDPLIPIKPRKGIEGDAPVKACPECGTYVHTSIMLCPSCGHEFEHKKIEYTLYDGSVIACDPARVDYFTLEKLQNDENQKKKGIIVGGVESVKFYKHLGKNRTYSLKVSYFVKTLNCREKAVRYDEYIHFNNYKPYPKHLAKVWWSAHCNDDVPVSTQEAFKRIDEFKRPVYIAVANATSKYPTITEIKPT